MGIRHFRFAILVASFAGVWGLAFTPASAQRGPVEHIRGTIAANDGKTLSIKARKGGIVKIGLPAKFKVSGLVKAELSRVKKGTYIGTAAAPGPGGALIAQELLIFPEKMRGVGEGHRPWDLTSDSTMTNATVEAVVDRVKGRQLILNYKGGQKRVIVPKGAPVVTIAPANKGSLVPGANVFVVARKDANGSLSVVRVSVGKDGLVPPM